ncbi:MAG: hypothetical protein COC05_00640 [Gammaproteobacteria bacterium]|nr:MAG: hypothetical protein COC05_00640 [Gammaproteobacteria bacterium]
MSIFVKYEGIIGDVSDAGHKGWMAVHELGWTVGRKITSAPSTRGDRESSIAEATHVMMTRLMDVATPDIFSEVCRGKGKDVKVHLTQTGKGDGVEVYMAYTLKNCYISNYTVLCSRKYINGPAERVTMSFTHIEVRYTSFDDKGVPITSASKGFDMATNMVA